MSHSNVFIAIHVVILCCHFEDKYTIETNVFCLPKLLVPVGWQQLDGEPGWEVFWAARRHYSYLCKYW